MFDRNKYKLSVIVPVYNEEGAVTNTFTKLEDELNRLGIQYEIIAVNDASTDKSLQLLKKIPSIILLNNPYNLGYGASLKRGLCAASGSWILIIDSDETYPIDKIPDLLQYANDYDMVVGNRNHKKDALGRRPAKFILKKLAGFLVNKDIPDINSGMRLFRKDLAMDFFNLYPSGFSFTTTITMCFFVHDYTIKYVPIPYLQRIGSSSIRPWHFFDFMALIFRLILFFKPLKMLFIPTVVIFILGVAKGIKDIIITQSIGNLSLILIVFSIQILIMAMILEIVTKKNIR